MDSPSFVARESLFVSELKARGLYEKAVGLCQPLGILVDELAGDVRYAPIIEARRAFVFYLRDELGWSQTMTGRLLRKDHTTIGQLLHGKRRGKR
jgi:hypothetical protein